VHYLAICKTFEQCAHLTAAECDSILELIKYLCKDSSGSEISLPSEYRQLMRTVQASTNHRRLQVFKQWVAPPQFIFNPACQVKLHRSPFVHYNIMDVICQQLLDSEVVGEQGEHFAVDFEMKLLNGKRVISDFHTGEYFRLGSAWVKANVGENVKFLPIIISTDKTVVGEGTTKTSFPCYLSLGNVKLKSMCKDDSTQLVGYLPELMDPISVIHTVLKEGGCNSKSLRNEAITVWKRHLEQEVRC
jgi:hypothetical protein